MPTEPLLVKFADGGQKKRQNQGKYLQNGRPWARDGDTVTKTNSQLSGLNLLCLSVYCTRVIWMWLLCVCSRRTFVHTAPVFAWPHWFWILCVVFLREEWRLPMTLQLYKMGEWYAHTDWKQPSPTVNKCFFFFFSFRAMLPSAGRHWFSHTYTSKFQDRF